jgi:hypothetical protein
MAAPGATGAPHRRLASIHRGAEEPDLFKFFVGGPQIKLDKLSLDQSGDFTDSLAVFAAPKRIGLRSHIQLSGVLVKSSLITLSDVSTHLRPG